jgi:hypothetical protein
VVDNSIIPQKEEFLSSRANTLSEIAEHLVGQDAGSVLFKAALLAWAKQDGAEAAIQNASIALANSKFRHPTIHH